MRRGNPKIYSFAREGLYIDTGCRRSKNPAAAPGSRASVAPATKGEPAAHQWGRPNRLLCVFDLSLSLCLFLQIRTRTHKCVELILPPLGGYGRIIVTRDVNDGDFKIIIDTRINFFFFFFEGLGILEDTLI